jgi:hypothetical protein
VDARLNAAHLREGDLVVEGALCKGRREGERVVGLAGVKQRGKRAAGPCRIDRF